MRIVRTKEQYDKEHGAYVSRKARALEGCDTCPCCGEKKDISKWFRYKDTKVWCFTTGNMINTYECKKCHAQWESEPY